MNTPYHAHTPCPDPRPAMDQALERAIELSPGTKTFPITDGILISEYHRH